MRKIILLMLVAVIPLLTMAQKRSKKGSKTDKITTTTKSGSAYEFMVIKGAEIDMSDEEDIDPAVNIASDAGDVSLERRMKRLIKPPVRLIIAFESVDIRGSEIRNLMSNSNELRTMSAAVEKASSYGWEFMNANVISTKDGVIHYYYMRRNK